MLHSTAVRVITQCTSIRNTGWGLSPPPPVAQAAAGLGSSALLVFSGVKMGARVMLDGEPLGNTTDQFLRYVFPVQLGAAGSRHRLQVVFEPDIACAGRWMACSGGWDWAPYSNRGQADGFPWHTYVKNASAQGGNALGFYIKKIK